MATTAYTGAGIDIAVIAGADLTAKQYYFIKLNNSGQAVVCSSAGEQVYGVLQNAPKSGEAAQVRRIGTTKVVSGGTVTLSGITAVTTDANGKLAAASSGNKPAGIAMMAAASGDIVTIDLQPSFIALP